MISPLPTSITLCPPLSPLCNLKSYLPSFGFLNIPYFLPFHELWPCSYLYLKHFSTNPTLFARLLLLIFQIPSQCTSSRKSSLTRWGSPNQYLSNSLNFSFIALIRLVLSCMCLSHYTANSLRLGTGLFCSLLYPSTQHNAWSTIGI